MKKIVKGNDFTLKIPVMKIVEGEAQAFPLPACTDVVVQVCNQFRRIPLAFTIDVKEDNVLLARVEGDKMSLGTYAIEVKGKIFGNDWRSNEYPQFSIVAKNADADTEFGTTDEGDNSVEMDTALVILPPSVELSDLINKTNQALKDSKATNTTLNANEDARKEAEAQRVSAESERVEAEQARVSAEDARMKAEVSRVSAESDRVRAEDARTKIEIERQANELTRKDNETKRVAAEQERAKAEEARVAAEDGRANAETERVNTETQRVNAENDRLSAEKGRVSAEDERVKAEKKRQTDVDTAIKSMNDSVNTAIEKLDTHRTEFDDAETARVSAEKERVDAESTRKQAEADRVSAEGARVKAEQARVAAETKRESDFNAAIKAANTATGGAEKVDAALTEENIFEVTDRTGVKKTLDLSGMVHAQSDVARIQESIGVYSDRPNITLAAKETNKAISADGVKVAKTGWAIAEFTAEKGNIYLFKPNEVDGDVCIFAEEITNIETRGIDYTYTYNTDGTIDTAKATYLGKTHTYTFAYAEDKSYTITDEAGEKVEALPMTYETKVGSYSPLVRLNADAELPIDGYCRYMSHFKGNSSIKIVVSYKIDAADLVMKVVRDGVFASISTQLGNLSQKEDETRKKIEELHGSYIELMWNADSWCNVDNKRIEVKAFKKYRFKPVFSFKYSNANHLVYADISHFDASKFVVTTDIDGYRKQIQYLFADSKIEKLDCRGMNVSGLQSINQVFKNCVELRELDIRGWDISECRTFTDNKRNSYSHSLFTNCKKLQFIYGLSTLDIRNIEDVSDLFFGCKSLTSIDVSNWDTSNVTDMRSMFNSCSSLTSLDVSNFDTSNVTDMRSMFNSCSSLTSLDVSNFDTSNVTDMADMFMNLDSLRSLNISNFDTRKVIILTGNINFISSSSLLTLDMSGDNFTLENVTSFGRGLLNTPKLRTLKLGKNFFKTHESVTSLSLSYQYWTDSSVKLSLVTNLYDRKANGLPDLTLTLHDNTKKVLSEDDIATITAKGYIIA